MDPLPSRRIGRPDEPGGIERVGRRAEGGHRRGGFRPGGRRGAAECCEEPLFGGQVVLKRAGGPAKCRDRRLERDRGGVVPGGRRIPGLPAAGSRRHGPRVRVSSGHGQGEGAERAGAPLHLLEPERLAKFRLGRAHPGGRGCAGGPGLPPRPRRAEARPPPPGARSSSARAWAAATRTWRSDSWRIRSSSERPIPSPTACAGAAATEAASSPPPPPAASERRSPPTSTAITATPAFVTSPPGSAPSGGATSFLQRLTGTSPSARTASSSARPRSGATHRRGHGGRYRARRPSDRRRRARVLRPAPRRAPATPVPASGGR